MSNMQFIHQSTYGNVGGFHTLKPLFAKSGNHIYEIKGGRPDTKPIYNIAGGNVYATSFHPNGKSPHADFEIHGNSMRTTLNHPNHDPIRALNIR